MSAQKQTLGKRAGEWLAAPGRFAAHGKGYRVTLQRADLEWLLQVLNDVRVGSWLILGCPDPDEGPAPEVNEANAKYIFLLELSSHFQCVLLEAVDGSE